MGRNVEGASDNQQDWSGGVPFELSVSSADLTELMMVAKYGFQRII